MGHRHRSRNSGTHAVVAQQRLQEYFGAASLERHEHQGGIGANRNGCANSMLESGMMPNGTSLAAAQVFCDMYGVDEVPTVAKTQLPLRQRINEALGKDSEKAAKVLSRLNGLSINGQVREREILEHVLKSPNAAQALESYAQLGEMIGDDEEKAARLSPNIIEMLVNGVADRRTNSDRGESGVLGGVHQVETIAKTLLKMREDDYAKVSDLLGSAGRDKEGMQIDGADAGTEQALILKALAARRNAVERKGTFDGVLSFFGADHDESGINDVTEFARDIRGMNRLDLVNQTTLADIDDRNTSTIDPNHLVGGKPDTVSDNDGLYQFYTTSCQSAAAQLVRGEHDPMYAMKLHRTMSYDEGNSEAAAEQKGVLEAGGGVAVSRVAAQASKRLEKATASLPPAQRAVMAKAAKGDELTAEESALYDKASSVVLLVAGLTEEEEALLERDSEKQAKGVNAAYAVTNISTRGSLSQYDKMEPGSHGQFQRMAEQVNAGQPAVYTFDYSGTTNGHAVMVNRARLHGSARQYLVTDPWVGATRWVDEEDLKTGQLHKTFGGSGAVQVAAGDIYLEKGAA